MHRRSSFRFRTTMRNKCANSGGMGCSDDGALEASLPGVLSWLGRLRGHGVIVTDRDGRTVWANEQVTLSTGYELSDLLGRTPGSVLQCEQTDPEAKRRLRLAMDATGPAEPVEVLNRTRTGRPLWLLIDIAPVRDTLGQVTHYFAIQTDITDRKLTADGWRSKAEVLHELNVVGFWERDLSTGAATWDAVCKSLWGLDPLDPAPTLDEAYARLTPFGRIALAKYKAGLEPDAVKGEVEYTVRTPGGERHIRSLWHQRGQVRSGVMLDLTSQRALSDEHARLLQTLELAAPAAHLAFWRHEVLSGAVHWLPSVGHAFARGPSELGDEATFLACVLPEDRDAVREARRMALEQSGAVELEYRVLDRDHRVRHLLTRRIGVVGPDGRNHEVIGVAIDVTAQRERELALRRQEMLQSLALKALRAGTFRLDLGRKVLECDLAMQAIYGLPPSSAELPLETWLGMVDERDRDWMRERLATTIAQPSAAAPVRFRITRTDGATLWMEADRVCEYDRHGNVTALVGTHRDVTAEVVAEEQARTLADAQLVARTRAEFLATLAHELRTPLNAVMGFAQLIQRDAHQGSHGFDPNLAASHIHGAGRMMLTLLDELRDLSAADAGALPWTAQRVNVGALLAECATWQVQSHGLGAAERLRVAPGNHGLEAFADPIRVRQIILNLVSNALKYSSEVIELSARLGADSVLLDVSDSGPGLTPDEIQRAFIPFERLERTRNTQPGSGLGLPLCRRLARMMGGDIDVSSAVGQGARFTLRLPLFAQDTGSR